MFMKPKVGPIIVCALLLTAALAWSYQRYSQTQVSTSERKAAIIAIYACERLSGSTSSSFQRKEDEADRMVAEAHAMAATNRDKEVTSHLDEYLLYAKESVKFQQVTDDYAAAGISHDQIGWRDQTVMDIIEQASEQRIRLGKMLE